MENMLPLLDKRKQEPHLWTADISSSEEEDWNLVCNY